MGLETGDLISSLNETWPTGQDNRSEGDDHLRQIKHVLRYTFSDTATAFTITKGAAALQLTSAGAFTLNGVPVGVVQEALVDGKQYARKNAAWAEVAIPASDWNTLLNKPATFPPTLPIAQGDVTNLTGDLALKAPLASPTFTGKVTTAASTTGSAGLNLQYGTAPTAPAIGDLWITTASMVYRMSGMSATVMNLEQNQTVSGIKTMTSPVFTGTPIAPTPAGGDNSTSVATTAFVKGLGYATTASLSAYAPTATDMIAGSGLIGGGTLAANRTFDVGAGTGITVAADTVSLTVPVAVANGGNGTTTGISAAVQTALDLKATLLDPIFTGNPRVPTAAPPTASTTAASTAFVANAIAAIPDPPPATSVGDAPPGSPAAGQQWFNSSDGRTYIYYDSQWVPAHTGSGPKGEPGIQGPIGPTGGVPASGTASATQVAHYLDNTTIKGDVDFIWDTAQKTVIAKQFAVNGISNPGGWHKMYGGGNQHLIFATYAQDVMAVSGQVMSMTVHKDIRIGWTGTTNPTGTIETYLSRNPSGDKTAVKINPGIINLTPGTAPSAPNDGDMWIVGSTLYVRLGGVTKTVTVA